jgi:hypothetical protein
MPYRCQTGRCCRTHMACMTKHVVKHSHHPKRELTYIVVLAYMPKPMDLRAIRFKYHDWIKYLPIGFQKVNLGTAQNDERFYSYQCSLRLHPTKSASLIDARGLLPKACMANEPMRLSIQKASGSWSMSLSTSTLFTHVVAQTKSKGLPVDVPLDFYTFYTCSAV